jgi:hypothetical protein
MQDWIRFWLRRNDLEFEESVLRRQEPDHECNLPADIQQMVDQLDRARHERDQFPVGVFFDSIDADRHGGIKPTAEKLFVVAEIGKDLLYEAICTADEDDNAEFFVHAYEHWGPLVDTVLEECDCGARDADSGRCIHPGKPALLSPTAEVQVSTAESSTPDVTPLYCSESRSRRSEAPVPQPLSRRSHLPLWGSCRPCRGIMPSTGLAPGADYHLEPRCRVCRNNSVRRKVNDLLAAGASYAMVVRALRDDNATLDKRDRVTIDSVRNHCARHFPVQNVAKATYREILERRAHQNEVDFIEGVATAITPMAFLKTVMAKSYEALVDSDTKVDVGTGIIAASPPTDSSRPMSWPLRPCR